MPQSRAMMPRLPCHSLIPAGDPTLSRDTLIQAAQDLSRVMDTLTFAPPVTHVYNPLTYAWAGHEAYLQRFGEGRKRVVFLGMNPGPFGMAQIGVPFGEVGLAREWLGIEAPIGKPQPEHPKRPIEGFACPRSEVSGRRLWGTIAESFGTPDRFFAHAFVANYCPLAFMEAGGRNVTPDKLPTAEREALYTPCDEHLRRLAAIVGAEWVIGVGGFAEERARKALAGTGIRIGRVLHPSPASPAANRDWAGKVRQELQAMGVCDLLQVPGRS
jgi:single-strand selective monofunctional uracil DNA glycosylase